MKKFRVLAALALLLVLLANASLTEQTSASAAGGFTRQIAGGGTTSLQAGAEGSDAIQWPEFVGEVDDDGDTAGGGTSDNGASGVVNRSYSRSNGAAGALVSSGKKAKSNPALNTSFDGLNFRQQRLANGGNQFSVEPPDQGLCAGNGFVMESVNDVLRVFDTAGNAASGVVDLNTFYGYPAAINRSTGVRGPFVTDPSCYYDNDTQRWFQVVLTLDTTPGGAFTGPNHIDIAVSKTSNPTGAWNIYRLPVQDDGSAGTPNHSCDGGPCLGDYPHIGADANGFYVTTNEYDFFGDGFHGAQIYAFSKAALASGVSDVAVTQFDTAGMVGGNPGFTVWPANSPAGSYALGVGGTEYFLSSNAAEEANGTGTSSEIILWSLTNTQSLNTASPALSLNHATLNVNPYAIPPKATQKAGDFPQGQCLNIPSCAVLLLGHADPFTEVESNLDSNDTRMQQVFYANGKLWGALDTALNVGGQTRAGIEYFIITPQPSAGGLKGKLVGQGYLGLADNDLTYPTIAVLENGRGVMSFTLTGTDYYPSAAFTSLDALVGAGEIQVAKAGLGPQDGFTGYKGQVGNPPRPRWGDYGASATDGKTIWFAAEYIGQTCDLTTYRTAPFGSCGGTRTSLGNWDTRITQVTP